MEFTLHQTFLELETLAAEWNDLLAASYANFPFLRYEYLSTWWETRGGGEWPASAQLAVITARQDGKLIGIAPFFFTNNQQGVPSLMLLGSLEISDYLDLIVPACDLRPFLEGLLDFLPGLPFPWKNLVFDNLLETSPTLPALQTGAAAHGWAFAAATTYHAPSIPLPTDFETYLAGIDKKQRHEIRRKMRRAEQAGTVDWYILSDPASLEADVEAFLRLMASDPEKAAFLTPLMRTQMQASARAAFKAGWLQLAFLTVDGQKAAAYLSFDYLGRIWVYNSGLDRQHMEFSPGWVLLGWLLRWATENGRREFDFMRGNEDYKYRFGGVDKLLLQAIISR
jgi:CelD/BcsL family acetyltransferase involved in cellulose biosynthesis